MPDVIFHIGLHKTATTTLQRQVFPACKGLNYLSSINDVNKFIQAVTTMDPIYYDASHWRTLVSPYTPGDMPTLISRESLSGALYAGVGKAGLDHRSAILANLKATLPGARIVIVLRRQDGLARSYYRQYIKAGGTESISVFYGLKDGKSPILSLDRFRFTAYIDEIVSLFPAGVLILTFEEFVQNRLEFLGRLFDFIGINPPNIELRQSNQTRVGSIGMEVSRILNHFLRSQLNPGGILPGIPKLHKGKIKWVSIMPSLQDRWPIRGRVNKNSKIYQASEEILHYVYEDNRMLDKRYGLGLDRYDYY